MSYPPELVPDDRDYVEDHPVARLRGAVTALAVGAVLIYGLVVVGGSLSEWVRGMGRFGSEEEIAVVQPGQTVQVEIPVGSTARGIAGILVDRGVIESAASFEAVVRASEAGSLLKAGTYELVTGTGAEEIVELLVAGPTLDVFRLTVVEGRRIEEVLKDIADQTGHARDELAATLLSGEVTSAHLPTDMTGVAAWEGLLFPATYEFFGDATGQEILQRMATETERRLTRIDWGSGPGDFSVYEALVMASLIEAEAGVDEDRPLIASVIYNRLENNIPLQIDATVLYALGERGRSPTLNDLEYESPHNTYRVVGLPPTPIGAPGFRSLEAVADPAETDYLYYVLTSENQHSFFVEYEDFLDAKQRAQEQGIGQ